MAQYELTIYAGSSGKMPVPQLGDLLRVAEVIPDVVSLHGWGTCTVVVLEPVAASPQPSATDREG